MIKAILILSNMTKSILKVSDADNGGSLDHVTLVKPCLNTMILLSNINQSLMMELKNFSRKM